MLIIFLMLPIFRFLVKPSGNQFQMVFGGKEQSGGRCGRCGANISFLACLEMTILAKSQSSINLDNIDTKILS